MKTDKKDPKILLREQILNSAIASFKIEGITIPHDVAAAALKKIEVNLGK